MSKKHLEAKLFHLRLEPDLREFIESRAARERRSMTNLIHLLLHQAHEADQNKQPAA